MTSTKSPSPVMVTSRIPGCPARARRTFNTHRPQRRPPTLIVARRSRLARSAAASAITCTFGRTHILCSPTLIVSRSLRLMLRGKICPICTCSTIVCPSIVDSRGCLPSEAPLTQATNPRRYSAFGRTLHEGAGRDVLGIGALHQVGELGTLLGSSELTKDRQVFRK